MCHLSIELAYPIGSWNTSGTALGADAPFAWAKRAYIVDWNTPTRPSSSSCRPLFSPPLWVVDSVYPKG